MSKNQQLRPAPEPPDLSRTVAAINAYDEHWGDEYDPAQADDLAQAVGVAFGLDTADRNNRSDCARLVRPGPRTPQPGADPSFVRRMVTSYLAEPAA